jgi:pimeloyl-ACP methyl ester carboxylesterase
MLRSFGWRPEEPVQEPPWRQAAWGQYQRDVVLAGRRMCYVDVGDGPAVVLVHGLASTWWAWFANIPHLALDYRVVAVDLPGFGGSDRLSRPTEIDDFVDALVGLLGHLGLGSVRIVGHSLGGIVAQRFAMRHPERTAALVLVASAGGPVSPIQATFFRGFALASTLLDYGPRPLLGSAMRAAMAVAPLRRWIIGQVVHDPAAVPQELAADAMSAACSSPGTAGAVLAGLRASRPEDLRRIACPTLIVGGLRDRLVPVSAVEHLASLIPGAQRELWPGVGHHPMLERPESFNALVRAFLHEVGPRSPT